MSPSKMMLIADVIDLDGGDMTPLTLQPVPLTTTSKVEVNEEALDPFLMGTFEQQTAQPDDAGEVTPLNMHSELISVPELLGLPILLQKQQSSLQQQ